MFLRLALLIAMGSWAALAGADATGAAAVPDLAHFVALDATPVAITPTQSFLCAGPPPDLQREMAHEPCIRVFADPVAAAALAAGGPLPVGSVIAKAKYAGGADRTPTLYTVMIKRAAGYAPAVGDFAFAVVSGDGTRWVPHDTRSCVNCHEGFAERGYLARDYRKVGGGATAAATAAP
jgi:hypothetical protein